MKKLKHKILLGSGGLSFIILSLFGYGFLVFPAVENRIHLVNELYVPLSKALSQVDSSFYLLESDLDQSLSEGIIRPKEGLETTILGRFEQIFRLSDGKSIQSAEINKKTIDLKKSFQVFSQVLNRIYQDWSNRNALEPELSSSRAEFRVNLKAMILDVDQKMRESTTEVQVQLRKMGLVLLFIFSFCFFLVLALSLWLAHSVKPLEALSDVMREISIQGLDEKVVKKISELPHSSDEIGTLSRESQKMIISLLDKSKILNEQKENLERARLELARQNQELRNTQEKLVHSEKLGVVGKMAAQMAHEIRNPLNALSLHTELLEEQLAKNPSANGIEPIRKEINRLIALTDSYLDFSKGPKLEKSRIQINDIIEELQDLYRPLLIEKGIFFTCDLGEIPEFLLDRAQLIQAIGNLIKNASESFELQKSDSGKFIRLITHFSNDKQEVTVTVMDNGMGIPWNQQKSIFSPFFTSKSDGTGLGLTLSKQIAEAHGGDIVFDSAEKKGTKFTIKLPIEISRGRHGSLQS